MKWKDKYRFVRQNMKKNKSRLFMTILATAMGCCFLVVLASVGFGFQRSITEQITSNGKVTEITLDQRFEGEGDPSPDAFLFSADELAYLEGLPHVEAVTKQNSPHLMTKYSLGGKLAEGVTPPIFADMAAEPKGTMVLAEGRYPEKSNEVVVGSGFGALFAEKAAGAEGGSGAGTAGEDSAGVGTAGEDSVTEANAANAGQAASSASSVAKPEVLNQKLTVTFTSAAGVAGQDSGSAPAPVEKTFTIVGVMEQPSRDWLNDPRVFLDRSLLPELATLVSKEEQGSLTAVQNVKLYASDMKHVNGIVETLKDKGGYHVYSILSELKSVNTVFQFVNIGLLFVGAIAVIIAAIGIYNTMTMAVTERTQDIGIMKAIGASPASIRSVFLMEISYIGIVGTLIGTAVAYVVSMAANKIIPMILASQQEGAEDINFTFSYIPFSLVAISAAISIGIAILSGMRPARRATEIDVLKALRRDI
ncbi:ABC transporter permease [Paenibacillus sp. GCM10023252]|uniref:ABC transporter permease n=1 Tax=Paenibacillus sp. GCM10023252 TaxID=3252649 RepID=UPI003622B88C